MKKYNREKRGTYKTRIHRISTHETCDGRDRYKRIHIPIRYDGYNKIEYIRIIYGKTRNDKAHTYVGVTNVMNDIFPEINAPHNAHTYRAIAPYHKYIPQETHHTRPIDTEDHTRTDTRRVKCIIYNKEDQIIHYGIFRRTRTINMMTHETHTTLHRSDRQIEVYPYIPRTDTIHGLTIREIKAHDVEIYHI